ncbi:MAG: putative transporter, partial [Rhodospirillaceae bacterium]|nr:putative transporter [Rhodospirillaceae bacterium]
MDPASLFAELDPITGGVLALCLVAVTGLLIGRLRLGTVSLGIGGVLFAGIFWGHLGVQVEPEVGHFLREFGLILFVYTIGIQVGPGFFSALRRSGLALNGMAAALVVLSTVVAAGIYLLFDVPLPAVLGLMSGATTNTPSLGAGTQMLATVGADTHTLAVPGLGYAVAYPFGIVGILLTMLLVRWVLRIQVDREQEAFETEQSTRRQTLERLSVEVTNPNLDGVPLGELPGLEALGIVVSRVLHDGTVQVGRPETPIRLGDTLNLVGRADHLRDMVRILGRKADTDVAAVPSEVQWRRLVVTNSAVLGRTIGDLDLLHHHDTVISRITRTGVELTPTARLHLQFGDICTVIGQPASLDAVAALLGNRDKALQEAQILPIFLGIALGVLLGSIPLAVPGMPAPLKLGLAGGPLLAAILLARLGHLGPFVWFMPPTANHVLREIGIVLFLGIVGLKAGDSFIAILTEGD